MGAMADKTSEFLLAYIVSGCCFKSAFCIKAGVAQIEAHRGVSPRSSLNCQELLSSSHNDCTKVHTAGV